MPELVTCPSCGCRVQVPETRLGLRTRCIACEDTFVAQAVLQSEDHFPLVPSDNDLVPPQPARPGRGRPRHRLPLCPGCHRPVAWDAADCGHCGHLFATEGGQEPPEFRRDGDNHRGELIDRLGALSLAFGCLTAGLGPVGLLVALATGLPALWMASRDLKRMTTGLVDPAGRALTDWGRSKAGVGVTLSAVLGVFWGLLFFSLFW